MEHESIDQLGDKLSLLDYAKLNSSVAYTLNSLYFSNLLSQKNIKFNSIYET